MNLSQQKRERMLNFLNDLKEKNKSNVDVVKEINEIETELTSKKYGLVWEEHEETIDKEMKTKSPIFIEDKTKELNQDNGKYNFLIEGDNLHSLYLLKKTHSKKIDIIYIDPPYNTGSKERSTFFKYNDRLIDNNDGYMHSKWLSFMDKRLRIAKELLTSKGIIFISIDDHEVENLILLCNEIFGADNHIQTLIWRKKYGGGKGTRFAVDMHEYILCYCNDIKKINDFLIDRSEKGKLTFNKVDEYIEERGKYYTRPLKSGLAYRKNLIYPIECPDGSFVETQWICGREEFEELKAQNRIVFVKLKDGTYNVYKKFYEYDNDGLVHPDSILYNIVYNQNGKEEIKKIFSIKEGRETPFNNPKPVELIKYLIKISTDKSDLKILDFFAGSGTTGQAVLELNNEDNGTRTFILCTNNESKICDEVTYPRLKNINLGCDANGNTMTKQTKKIIYQKELKINMVKNSKELFEEINTIKKENKNIYEKINMDIQGNMIVLTGINNNQLKFNYNLKYYRTGFVEKNAENFDVLINKHAKELVQLENAVNIDDKTVLIAFDNDDLTKQLNTIEDIKQISKLYVSRFVMLNSKQKRLLKNAHIEVIPDYYFKKELKEKGLNWR